MTKAVLMMTRPTPATIAGLLFCVTASMAGCKSLTESMFGDTPHPIQTQGVYVHELSGFAFPEQVGVFRRQQVVAYDPAETRVSVGYKLARSGTAVGVTVYVYTAPSSQDTTDQALEARFKRIQLSVWKNTRNARLESVGTMNLNQGGRIISGRFALFTAEQNTAYGVQRSFTHKYLFRHKNFFVEYSVNSFQPYNDMVDVEIKEFLESLKWPSDRQPLG